MNKTGKEWVRAKRLRFRSEARPPIQFTQSSLILVDQSFLSGSSFTPGCGADVGVLNRSSASTYKTAPQ
jgi:hypothetical protein